MTSVTTTTRSASREAAIPAPRTDAQLLAAYAETRDPHLREALVERFLPLARSIAKRYRKAEEPFDDLLQVASLGLLKAVDRFDPARGIAFSSFAVPTIVGELRRHFRDRCWSVRPPRELQERALEVDKYRTELTSRLGRSPSVREIGQALELADEQVLEALQAQQGMRAASLDAPRGNGDDQDATLADAHGILDPELMRAEHRATISRLFERLDERERRVLRLRFQEDMTQEQIGKIVGVSQMQVSRIIRGAIAKLSAARGDV
ncbi:MAG TPA: SigB/SigF/SigG family RNA polymerase sigma factor [Baekduia sp.]|uniref:SigB/SigF/SigG family RNA polymerase sigma factor n=1 Tax=Baekduia sp. TaxID=2600305 RepID=UPI002D78779C|nr:SigB/SigF/SigG family RNA polymerase sigma factor [Baekduia sp.]HET6506562.1 SigB/SigF/SigG family RNA polymerase sigma factor [Baekduia sp.]